MGNTKKLIKTKDVDQRPKNGERTTKVGAHGSVAVERVGQPIPVLVGYIPNKDREVTLPTRTTLGSRRTRRAMRLTNRLSWRWPIGEHSTEVNCNTGGKGGTAPRLHGDKTAEMAVGAGRRPGTRKSPGDILSPNEMSSR